jgi:hypothetical protein
MQAQKFITLVVLGALVSGFSLTASVESTAPETATYISVPMSMFNRLTGNKEKKAPEYFTYQDDKLVKCSADIQGINAKECRKKCDRRNKGDRRGKTGRMGRGHFGKDNQYVLLTLDQVKDLTKKKLEQRIQDIDNSNSEMAKAIDKSAEKVQSVKINDKDAKVITFSSIHQALKKNMKCSYDGK